MSIPAETGMTPVLILVAGAMQGQSDLGSPMQHPESQPHAKPSHKGFQVTSTRIKNRFSESSWPYLNLQPRFLNQNLWKIDAVEHQGSKNLNLLIITARWPIPASLESSSSVRSSTSSTSSRFWNPESWFPSINRCGLWTSIHTTWNMSYKLRPDNQSASSVPELYRSHQTLSSDPDSTRNHKHGHHLHEN